MNKRIRLIITCCLILSAPILFSWVFENKSSCASEDQDRIKLPQPQYTSKISFEEALKSRKSVRNYSTGFDAIANLLNDFNQPVFKIQGLAEALAMDNDQLVQKKIESVQLSRSVARAVILDKEDEFSNIGASVGGLSDLLKLTVDRLVGGSGIPHTRLLGESPSGLGATGNSELTDYYDMIKAQQELNLRKPLQYLIDLLGMQKGAVKMPEDLSFSFCSLYGQKSMEESSFEYGERLYNERFYPLAALQFQNYLEQFPAAPNAADAFFLMGQSHFMAGDFKSAQESWLQFIIRFPDHEKCPDGHYGIAESRAKCWVPRDANFVSRLGTDLRAFASLHEHPPRNLANKPSFASK